MIFIIIIIIIIMVIPPLVILEYLTLSHPTYYFVLFKKLQTPLNYFMLF